MTAARRSPARDQVAIVGVGRSPYSRSRTDVSQGGLVAEATVAALRDAGLQAEDIDGICGSGVAAQWLQAALGIPAVTWFANPAMVIGNQIVAAVGTFSFSVLLFALALFGELLGPEGDALDQVNLIAHMDLLARGLIDSQAIVFHLSVGATATFLAGCVLELGRER